MDRDLGRLIEVGREGVAESTVHGWYGDGGDARPRHPSSGLTEPAFDGPAPPFDALAGRDRYTWLKAPRYEGDPMEVGPLARVLVGLAGHDRAIEDAVAQALSTLGLRPEGLFGTVGRIVARAIDAQVVTTRLAGWLSGLRDNLASGEIALADLSIWDPAGWPAEAEGYAIGESAQGAVGHWVALRDGRIAACQVVDATTWNASPRDAQGRRGALEEALVGTPVADPERPLEILRTIHSFDPCLSCGVH
jgi:Ni,Fe-hydrogenase I large subunit